MELPRWNIGHEGQFHVGLVFPRVDASTDYIRFFVNFVGGFAVACDDKENSKLSFLCLDNFVVL